jgi:hypothetical protein
VGVVGGEVGGGGSNVKRRSNHYLEGDFNTLQYAILHNISFLEVTPPGGRGGGDGLSETI